MLVFGFAIDSEALSAESAAGMPWEQWRRHDHSLFVGKKKNRPVVPLERQKTISQAHGVGRFGGCRRLTCWSDHSRMWPSGLPVPKCLGHVFQPPWNRKTHRTTRPFRHSIKWFMSNDIDLYSSWKLFRRVVTGSTGHLWHLSSRVILVSQLAGSSPCAWFGRAFWPMPTELYAPPGSASDGFAGGDRRRQVLRIPSGRSPTSLMSPLQETNLNGDPLQGPVSSTRPMCFKVLLSIASITAGLQKILWGDNEDWNCDFWC